MIDRLWITGALLACLFGAGVITLLVFSFLRFHSRLILMYMITILGAVFLLVSGILRVVPAIRFYGDGNMIGYKILSVSGICVLAFGLPNLALELTNSEVTALLIPYSLALAIAGGIITAVGMVLGFPVVVALSETLVIIIEFYSAGFVLAWRNRVLNRSTRRFAISVSLAVIITAPLAVLLVYLWNRSTDPFGHSLPPYMLMIFLFLINGTTLILSSYGIVRSSKKIVSEFDSAAIAAYEITPRECDIILYICQGCSNDEIGARLFISSSTVKNHVYHIYRKTGARNRIELMNTVLSSKEAG
jgi:DNA-binding CsgD family transcriptional regulator